MQRAKQGTRAGNVLGEGIACIKALELRQHVCSEKLKWFSLSGVWTALTAKKKKTKQNTLYSSYSPYPNT